MRTFGLIGKKLGHSFSQRYFNEKFEQENLKDCRYQLFELENIKEFPGLLKAHPDLRGLNVTIPYKESIIPYLNSLDPLAERIGAVNVVKPDPATGQLVGYNTDAIGFKRSLQAFLPDPLPSGLSALVLGTGGASKAVEAVFQDLGIPITWVSRNESAHCISYQQITDTVAQAHLLVVNTTPLGMLPQTETAPQLPYESFTPDHYFYDLVYNPAITLFMKKGSSQGAKVKNGLEMLYQQADAAWEIWNSL